MGLPEPGSPGAGALADRVVAALVELRRHLPPGEIPPTDDEAALGLDADGNLVAVATADAVYRVHSGCAWRYVRVGDVEEVTAFMRGQAIGTYSAPVHEDDEDGG